MALYLSVYMSVHDCMYLYVLDVGFIAASFYTDLSKYRHGECYEINGVEGYAV